MGNIFNPGGAPPKPGDTLKEHSIDLTALAAENRLDPVIGRDEEIKRLIQVLSRRSKNNPCLVGLAGVGKTAIIEGLAQRIHNKQVPERLLNKRVLSIDLSSVVAGTGIRGSFEEKLKALLKDVEEQQDSAICFIDEVHTLLNLGQAEGTHLVDSSYAAIMKEQARCRPAT
jgi:ATP-dependent Clp protease ATP-binding subunit ClpB